MSENILITHPSFFNYTNIRNLIDIVPVFNQIEKIQKAASIEGLAEGFLQNQWDYENKQSSLADLIWRDVLEIASYYPVGAIAKFINDAVVKQDEFDKQRVGGKYSFK